MTYNIMNKVSFYTIYNLYLCPQTMVELWKEKI